LPFEVTGGLETVAVRIPNHPVALALLKAVALPVAAPSANRFTQLSPTHSRHVESDLGDAVDYILEGGDAAVGIESTILDLTGERPSILRPGGLSREQLEQVLGPLTAESPEAPKVPGMHPLHYAPRAKVELVKEDQLARRARELAAQGARVGLLLHGATAESFNPGAGHSSPKVIRLGGDHTAVARGLYSALRELDQQQVDVVLTTLPEAQGLGVAIADRLTKAAGSRR
jgi:L-threonylcarbamoyladenylate synthase